MAGRTKNLSYALAFIKGALVGVANIIPGVSGGTFALILGIYERLLASISAIRVRTLKIIWFRVAHSCPEHEVKKTFADELQRTDIPWLAVIITGAVVGIIACSYVLTYLLEEYLETTLAFFLGLIVMSISVPFRLLERRTWKEGVCCIIAMGALGGIMYAQPACKCALGLVGLFLAGVLAASAMILPGISGSFLLLIIGEYKTILNAIVNLQILKLGVFVSGCLVGILLFVRVLNFLLVRFHSITMASLIGLMLGSLWALWPYKIVSEGGEIITGTNVLPQTFTLSVAWSACAFIGGVICSKVIFLSGKKQKLGK